MTGGGSPLRAGVLGVGSMGRHHARVYEELTGVELAGVADADPQRATAVAERYQTRPLERGDLLDSVDVVSVATPTRSHYEAARDAIDSGVHVLVEKPFVDDRAKGRGLLERAHDAGLTLQVGHIERFNPAVRALGDIVPDLDVIAVTADRLGPPLSRELDDDVILDLMIHDVDVLLSIVDGDVTRITADSIRDGQYATATVAFDSGVLGTLTASRVTQQKVRRLSITAEECRVNVDYAAQSVQIHRHTLPEYVERDGDVRYRQESVIEQPSVDSEEPLKRELASFLGAVRTGDPPVVTGEDGLRAIAFCERIRSTAGRAAARRSEVPA